MKKITKAALVGGAAAAAIAATVGVASPAQAYVAYPFLVCPDGKLLEWPVLHQDLNVPVRASPTHAAEAVRA